MLTCTGFSGFDGHAKDALTQAVFVLSPASWTSMGVSLSVRDPRPQIPRAFLCALGRAL